MVQGMILRWRELPKGRAEDDNHFLVIAPISHEDHINSINPNYHPLTAHHGWTFLN